MPNLPPSVISIWIPKQGLVDQGKFFLLDGKPYFVANMTSRKWFRNFSGYAISKRILDALPRGTTIAYKRVDLNCYYLTNKTAVQAKGILGSWGGHSQWVLPLKNWKTVAGKLAGEPKNLDKLALDIWLKGEQPQARVYTLYDLKNEWEEKVLPRVESRQVV